MIKPFVIRNPGCEYCRHYLAPFDYKGERTKTACVKGAQKIFQQGNSFFERRNYKWIGCGFAAEKNKDRYCEDFRVYSLTRRLIRQLTLLIQRAGQQLPPSFGGEMWWNH